MLKSVNPFTQALINEFTPDSNQLIDEKLRGAEIAFATWRKESFAKRSLLLKKAAVLLRERSNRLALIVTEEMGKPIKESRAEINKCADACDYFADHAASFLSDSLYKTEASRSFVCFEPLGPVLAIMPWNFPFWQVFRFAAPTLMAGNVALLKHASNVSQCSIEIEKIFLDAGFPVGVFQSLLVESSGVDRIIANEAIRAVTITGSEIAGAKVAATAGKYLKKCVLELGGSDPFIVLDDADLELSAKIGTQSRMQNAGQSCIAAKRFIVVGSIKEEFCFHFKKNIEALVQGNPTSESTTIGPLARIDLAEDLENQLRKSIEQGAAIVTGGSRVGCNFQPTLIDRVRPGMVAFDDELFGPIASIITAKNEDEAIKLANLSRYGLGGSVWTKDKERGERVARQIESGSVFVNSLMRSDQRLPFGGIKKSGYGRELSDLGIKEFVNAKTIYVE